jgi:hypothetical protein
MMMAKNYDLPIVLLGDEMEHGILAFSYTVKPHPPIGPEFNFKLVNIKAEVTIHMDGTPEGSPGIRTTLKRLEGPQLSLYWASPDAEAPDNILLIADVVVWLVAGEGTAKEQYIITLRFREGIESGKVAATIREIHQQRGYWSQVEELGGNMIRINVMRESVEPEHLRFRDLLPKEL